MRTRTPKGLTDERFRELFNACLQYGEWADKLEELEPLRGVALDGLPKGHDPHGIEALALKRAEISKKINTVDRCLDEAGGEMREALFYGVTRRGWTYDVLERKGLIYGQRGQYFQRRRQFFVLLDDLWP